MKNTNLLCTIVLIFCITFILKPKNIFADQVTVDFDSSALESIIDGYLNMIDISSKTEFSISQMYKISNESDTNYYMYFIFESENCIGELLLDSENGSSAFYQERCEIISNFYMNNTPFCLIMNNDSVFLHTALQSIQLWGNIENDRQELFFPIYKYEPINLKKVELKNQNLKSGYSESNYLDVPIIENESSPDTGSGLCWLASTLSVSKYNNSAISYTLLTLYYSLRNVYPPSTYGYPTGTSDFFLRAFWLNGITANYLTSGMTYSEVKNQIDSYKPVISVLMNSTLTSSHAVVICGYSKSTQTGLYYYYYYRIMDPNCDNYVLVSVPGSGVNYNYLAYSLWTSSYTY